ncbi:Leucine-rich repeat serine/threonine-protein kinase 2 [Dinochytrium kinnereticum]|nr:Leucine-rich repeat serine/threonine-protein kinase 2 [Dinochytrium kinnereticum]
MQTAVIPSDAIAIDTSQPIGSGASGVVYRARYANETVVVKRLKLHSLSRAAQEEFKQEASTLSKLNHPRIVRFLGVVIDKEYSIVLEYLPHGSLYKYYNEKPKLPYRNRLSIAVDVTSGMEFLHGCKPPVLHRDLKSLNILLYNDVSGELHAKITDFGIALAMQSTMTIASIQSTSTVDSQKGTLIWMAPELHDLRAVYRTSSDVYSFGVVLSELFSWVGPFGIPTNELRYDVLHHMLTVQKQVPDVEVDDDVPTPILKLVESCVALNEKDRPTFKSIFKELNAFVKDGDCAEGMLDVPSVEPQRLSTTVFEVNQTKLSEPSSSEDPDYHQSAFISTLNLSPTTPSSISPQADLFNVPATGSVPSFAQTPQEASSQAYYNDHSTAGNLHPTTGYGFYPSATNPPENEQYPSIAGPYMQYSSIAAPAGYMYAQDPQTGAATYMPYPTSPYLYNPNSASSAQPPPTTNATYPSDAQNPQAPNPTHLPAPEVSQQIATPPPIPALSLNVPSTGLLGSNSAPGPSYKIPEPSVSVNYEIEQPRRRVLTRSTKIGIIVLVVLLLAGASIGVYFATKLIRTRTTSSLGATTTSAGGVTTTRPSASITTTTALGLTALDPVNALGSFMVRAYNGRCWSGVKSLQDCDGSPATVYTYITNAFGKTIQNTATKECVEPFPDFGGWQLAVGDCRLGFGVTFNRLGQMISDTIFGCVSADDFKFKKDCSPSDPSLRWTLYAV